MSDDYDDELQQILSDVRLTVDAAGKAITSGQERKALDQLQYLEILAQRAMDRVLSRINSKP